MTEAVQVAPAVHVTDQGGERQAAKHEAGCAQKGQGKGLGTKGRMRPRGISGNGGWEGGRGRKNEQKNPRRTKGHRDRK